MVLLNQREIRDLKGGPFRPHRCSLKVRLTAKTISTCTNYNLNQLHLTSIQVTVCADASSFHYPLPLRKHHRFTYLLSYSISWMECVCTLCTFVVTFYMLAVLLHVGLRCVTYSQQRETLLCWWAQQRKKTDLKSLWSSKAKNLGKHRNELKIVLGPMKRISTLVLSKIVFCLVLTIKQSLILLCNCLLNQCMYILRNQN